jgi:PKD repeat protein
MNATHAYATAGTYTTTLTVTDDKGATDADTATVTVANRPPVANAGPDRSATQGTNVAFNGSASSDPDGTIVSYAWAFGDGGTATGVAPSHAYATPGTYSAQLTVTDNRNATATDSAVVTVTPADPTLWGRRLGASTGDTVEAVAADASGNVVAVGAFRGSVDFGGTSVTSAGGADWFVAKYAPTGTLLWVKRMGGTTDDAAMHLAIAANGDVVVTGRFSGTASFGGSPLVASGSVDIALARYGGADGAHQWSRRFGGAYDDGGAAVAIDASGAIVLTGYFRGVADFGTGPLRVPFDSDLDVFVAKFAANGTSLWSKNFVNSGNDRGYGVAVDGSGNVLVAGTFSNTIDLGGLELNSPNALVDIFVCKLDASGGHVWSRQIGSATGNEGAETVAVDGSGNVVVAGYAIAAVDFGGGELDPLGAADAFVAKYSGASGAHLWSRRFGGAGNDYGAAVAVDAGGSVYLAGSFDESASFGGPALTAAGQDDAYVTKLNANGGSVWARRLGGTSSDVGLALATLPLGYSVTGGYFYGTGTFGGSTLASNGAADGFLATIAP